MDLIEIKEFKGNRHPWEISRRRCIMSLIKGNPRSAQYADIGAGDLYVCSGLKDRTSVPIYAVDSNYTDEQAINTTGIIKCKDLKGIPDRSIDCMLLLDVLEHIEHDAQFLKEVSVLLKAGGVMIVTVPAFDFLFSGHDIFLKHFRRYDHKGLIPILRKCGLEVNEHFYFYTSLFLVRFFKTLFKKSDSLTVRRDRLGNWRFGRSNPVTIFAAGLLRFEFLLSRLLKRAGVTIPGLSLCVICRKRSV